MSKLEQLEEKWMCGTKGTQNNFILCMKSLFRINRRGYNVYKILFVAIVLSSSIFTAGRVTGASKERVRINQELIEQNGLAGMRGCQNSYKVICIGDELAESLMKGSK